MRRVSLRVEKCPHLSKECFLTAAVMLNISSQRVIKQITMAACERMVRMIWLTIILSLLVGFVAGLIVGVIGHIKSMCADIDKYGSYKCGRIVFTAKIESDK